MDLTMGVETLTRTLGGTDVKDGPAFHDSLLTARWLQPVPRLSLESRDVPFLAAMRKWWKRERERSGGGVCSFERNADERASVTARSCATTLWVQRVYELHL